ncbi:aminoacyl-tRNA hydrolase [Nakamurella silvestris]|nr:aminoacyl-tRNA hydrolase [Nakamurella silvestris]
MASIEKALIVGLGNPGPGYAHNRHNAGAMVTDLLAARIGGKFKSHKSGADICEGRLGGSRVILAKPRSYMNLSGGATAGAAKYFGVDPADVVVIHDELDVDYGIIRLKFGGGEGGHNGLRSISTSLGTKDYHRVRFGVSRPPGRQDPADYVLKDFSAAERKTLALELENAADATELLLELGLTAAQNKLH